MRDQRLTVLVDAYLDGCLTDEQRGELESMLLASPEARAGFWEQARFHALIRRWGQEEWGRRLAQAPASSPKSASPAALAHPARKGQWRLPRRLAWGLAAAACLAIAAGLWFMLPMNRAVELVESHGEITVLRSAQVHTPPVPGSLRSGDVVFASADADALLVFHDPAMRVHLKGPAELRLGNPADSRGGELVRGRLEADVAKRPPGQPVVIRTPAGQAEVLGTRFGLSAGGASTWLDVREGAVRLTRAADRASTIVKAGEFAVAGSGLALQPWPVSPDGRLAVALPLELSKPHLRGEGQWTFEDGVPAQHQVSHPRADPSRPDRAAISMSHCVFDASTQQSIEVEVAPQVMRTIFDQVPGWPWHSAFGVRFMLPDQHVQVIHEFWSDRRSAMLLLVDRVDRQGAGVGKLAEVYVPMPPHDIKGDLRMRVQLLRESAGETRIRGKVWPAAASEPGEWTIDHRVRSLGPVTQLGVQTESAAVTFKGLKVTAIPPAGSGSW